MARTKLGYGLVGAAALAVAVAIPAVVLSLGDRGAAVSRAPVAGVPATADYHSLLVAADDPRVLLLGTHSGLYESRDGGLTWRQTALDGRDAMNLGRASRGVMWAAGHDVLATSTDGGRSWQQVRPDGLPHLDIHGFAVDPRDPTVVWAALAGHGLYRSKDGGRRFELVTRGFGATVTALAVTPAGRLLAVDVQQGLFTSDDEGETWRLTLNAGLLGLAVNPADPEVVLASGPGILRSRDGGRTWNRVLALERPVGPVAWAPSEPSRAYAVGLDRSLYETTDGGKTWRPLPRAG